MKSSDQIVIKVNLKVLSAGVTTVEPLYGGKLDYVARGGLKAGDRLRNS